MEKPECVVEIVGEIPKSGIAYFGFEPSGRLHRGILHPIRALQWVSSFGLTPVVWVADVHARLNGKTVDVKTVEESWKALENHIEAVFKLESAYMNHQWLTAFMKLAGVVNLKRAIRSIDCAGRNEDIDGMKMSWLVYALLQAVDIHCLNVDVAIGGTDQRKIHMLVRDAFPKLGWKVPAMVHTSLLLGKDGLKMSKSRPEYCEFL